MREGASPEFSVILNCRTPFVVVNGGNKPLFHSFSLLINSSIVLCRDSVQYVTQSFSFQPFPFFPRFPHVGQLFCLLQQPWRPGPARKPCDGSSPYTTHSLFLRKWALLGISGIHVGGQVERPLDSEEEEERERKKEKDKIASYCNHHGASS